MEFVFQRRFGVGSWGGGGGWGNYVSSQRRIILFEMNYSIPSCSRWHRNRRRVQALGFTRLVYVKCLCCFHSLHHHPSPHTLLGQDNKNIIYASCRIRKGKANYTSRQTAPIELALDIVLRRCLIAGGLSLQANTSQGKEAKVLRLRTHKGIC